MAATYTSASQRAGLSGMHQSSGCSLLVFGGRGVYKAHLRLGEKSQPPQYKVIWLIYALCKAGRPEGFVEVAFALYFDVSLLQPQSHFHL